MWCGRRAGKRTTAIVELVDLYKTVCDLLGVALPSKDTHVRVSAMFMGETCP